MKSRHVKNARLPAELEVFIHDTAPHMHDITCKERAQRPRICTYNTTRAITQTAEFNILYMRAHVIFTETIEAELVD